MQISPYLSRSLCNINCWPRLGAVVKIWRGCNTIFSIGSAMIRSGARNYKSFNLLNSSGNLYTLCVSSKIVGLKTVIFIANQYRASPSYYVTQSELSTFDAVKASTSSNWNFETTCRIYGTPVYRYIADKWFVFLTWKGKYVEGPLM